MTTRISILLVALSVAATLSAQDATTDNDFHQEVNQRIERQRAAYAADMAANRQWMQEMTREFENQNEVIRKLNNELQSLRKEVASLKASKGSDNIEISRLRSELLNKISDETQARQAADQRLVKSVSREIARAAKSAPAPTPRQPVSQPAVRTIKYTVEPGDTLSAIATAFGTSISKIKSLNGLSSDVIRVGQKIKVPAP